MKHIIFGLWVSMALFFSSCSLLKLQLNSNEEPLSTTEMNIRIYSHTFVSTFCATLEDAVDSVKNMGAGPRTIGNSLIWLMNNESAVQDAVFQINPRVALADTWLLTLQMKGFLDKSGKQYFENYSPVLEAAVSTLNSQIEHAARRMQNAKEYNTMRKFVEEQNRQSPILELTYSREPIYGKWLQYNNMPDTTAVSTVGTLPQVIAGFSDRFSVMAGQLNKIARWQLELISLNTGITPESMKALGDSVDKRVSQFIDFSQTLPQYMDTSIVKISAELREIGTLFDRRIAITMTVLQQERAALEEMIARERAIIMADADSISTHLTQVVIRETADMLKSILLYICLFFAIILFIPFGMGFASGRIFTRRKYERKDKEEKKEQS